MLGLCCRSIKLLIHQTSGQGEGDVVVGSDGTTVCLPSLISIFDRNQGPNMPKDPGNKKTADLVKFEEGCIVGVCIVKECGKMQLY